MEEQVLKTINKYNLIKSGDKIVLAVSGGPDSIFMLDILNKIRQNPKNNLSFNIIVCHVNHMIRKESEEESREIGKKKAAELSYGRGMTKKKTERTKEKKWESVIVYSYSARHDIWRCIYCDGENPVSEEYCQVCGKKRQRQK